MSAAAIRRYLALLVLSVAGLGAGGVAHLAGSASTGHVLWLAVTALGIASASWWVGAAAVERRLGADVVALAALVGTVAVGEYLAGALVTTMLATGRELDAWAAGRARRDLSALVERTPTVARVHRSGQLVELPLAQVAVGDLVTVATGEVIPLDGLLDQGLAVLDESALTGEPVPRTVRPGEPVRSGAVNGGPAFELRVTTLASEGTYATILRLVEVAETSVSPSERLADRYARWFVVASAVAAGSAWAASGSVTRAVAVLVVATPCPLVLAVPVALVSGLALAARSGVIVKGGAVLERLARGGTLLLDKTGTLTRGSPVVTDVACRDGVEPDEVLRLAASLDQVSPHVLAASIVATARARDLALDLPRDAHEEPGSGIRGRVGRTEVALGRADWLGADTSDDWLRAIRRQADLDGSIATYVSLDGRIVGAILMDDPIRPGAALTVRNLRADGFDRIVMVTGDREDIAESVGAVIGVDAVYARRGPAEKVDAVEIERRRGPTVMVGDGINDAPALALADVGVALGGRGSTAASEAADVVLSVDRLESLGDAVVIARRSKRRAAEAAATGIGLSVVAMAVAGVGWLPASLGALLQEGIDVAAILVALRALVPARRTRLSPADKALLGRFAADRAVLDPFVTETRTLAARLANDSSREVVEAVRSLHSTLSAELEPLQVREEGELYPAVARLVGGTDPTGGLLRAHAEIRHDLLRIRRVLDLMDPDRPDRYDVLELQRLLYDLHAVWRLHLAQEREGYASLHASATQAPAAPTT